MNNPLRLMMAACYLLLTALALTPAPGSAANAKPAELNHSDWEALQRAIIEEAKLTNPSGAGAEGFEFDEFGTSVAVDGDTALVGAPQDEIVDVTQSGAVYVYVRSGATWTLQAKLIADDADSGDRFGEAVALSGDTALIGAPEDDVGGNDAQGSAYVFVRSGGSWSQQAKLLAGDGAAGDEFGVAVALSADTALIGAHLDEVGGNAQQGSAYVYTGGGSSWSQQAQLLAPDGAADDRFGAAVALSGDSALVGARFDDVGMNDDQGSAHVYVRSGVNWSAQAQLFAADGDANDRFGWSVALDGDSVLVGAPFDDVGANNNQGSAYVYSRSGVSWSQQAQLQASDGSVSDNFGGSVALSGETALVGADEFDLPGQIGRGAAYAYLRSGVNWSEQAQLLAAAGEGDDNLGFAVALSGDTAVIGAPEDDVLVNSDQGSASFFQRAGAVWTEQQTVDTGVGEQGNGLGTAVALSGDTAVVSSPGDEEGLNRGQGSVFVFVRDGMSWSLQSRLVAADGAAEDGFGDAVAIEGDTIVVGADGSDQGANQNQGSAYVYTRSGGVWSERAKLVAADGGAFDEFGNALALSGDTLLVGAWRATEGGNVRQGAAYVYTGSGDNWTLQARLVAADGAFNDRFGNALALSGDTALIASELHNANQGAAYVFLRTGSAWALQQKLVAADGAAGDSFGEDVALFADTALIGAPNDDSNTGVAYVYQRSGASWSEQAQLRADDGETTDFFGGSVALSADTALVGAASDSLGAGVDQGSAYAYTRDGAIWSQQGKLTASDGQDDDNFGGGVALSGGIALIGARNANGPPLFGGPNEGAAYVYTGIGQEDSFTTITSALPDPSQVAEAVSIDITVDGATSAPADGMVVVSADTGESCTDASPTAGAGLSILYSCQISFASVGPRQLTAVYSGSLTHAESVSAGEAHAVITTLSLAPNTLPGGTFGVAYSQTVSASGPGSSAPYSYQVSSGALPDGLMLDPNSGEISGDPSAAGMFDFGITASDSSGAALGGPFTGALAYSIVIARADQAPLTAIADPATIMFDGSSALSSSGGSGTGAVSFAVTAGMAFCEVNGTTLTGIGVGSCTVTATKAADSNYNAASATVDVTVNQADQAPLTAIADPAMILFGASSSLSSSGGSGTGVVGFAVTAGMANCDINGTTLTGIGVGSCTVTATKAADSNYNAATATVDVTVQAATDLEVSKSDGRPNSVPGGVVVYEILVANAGPLDVQGAGVSDPVPAGLSNALWTCTPVQLASCPNAAGSGAIDETVDLPVNAVLRYEFSAEVSAPLGATVTNTATISVPVDFVEIEPADNSASDANIVVPEVIFLNGFEQPDPPISVPMR